MTDDPDGAELGDLVRQRVEQGKAAGWYSDDLDEQLAQQFQRAAVDPLKFPVLEALPGLVDSLRIPTLADLRVHSESMIPAGAQVHNVVSRLVGRQIGAVLTSVSQFGQDVQGSLRGVIDSLEELRSIVTTEVFGDLDSVHHRLVAVEQRLARLESERSAVTDE